MVLFLLLEQMRVERDEALQIGAAQGTMAFYVRGGEATR
jgi:hypothetical protein